MDYWSKPAAAAVFAFVLATAGAAEAQCLSRPGIRTTTEGAAVGAILGAIIGAAVNENDRNEGAVNGAAIGAVAGAATGCAMAQRQALLAAREDAMYANAARLEGHAASLEAYNATLAQDVESLRERVAEAQALESRRSRAYRQTASQLRDAQSNAREQLGEVDALANDIEGRLANMSPREPEYARKRGALERQRTALIGARAYLNGILAMRA